VAANIETVTVILDGAGNSADILRIRLQHHNALALFAQFIGGGQPSGPGADDHRFNESVGHRGVIHAGEIFVSTEVLERGNCFSASAPGPSIATLRPIGDKRNSALTTSSKRPRLRVQLSCPATLRCGDGKRNRPTLSGACAIS